MRIDAHQHYWCLQRGDYGWLNPSLVPLYRDFTPVDLSAQLQECAVSATILVQAAPTEAETRYLLRLAGQNASIAAVVGWVDFEAPDVARRMRSLVQHGGGRLKGLRPMIQDIPDPQWLDRRTIDAAFEALIAQELRFDALVLPSQLTQLEQRLRRHPTLRTVLDHAAKPGIAAEAFEPWASDLARLAQNPQVYCKLSGLLTEAPAGAAVAQLERYVAHVFACFGAARVMWGSDWPVLTLRASYRQWFEMAQELVQRHAPGSEEAVFATNAARFYGLDALALAGGHSPGGQAQCQ